MTPTKLFTRTGGYVITVLVPPFTPPAEIINWGSRFFVRQPNGEYREGLVWAAKVVSAATYDENEVADAT